MVDERSQAEHGRPELGTLWFLQPTMIRSGSEMSLLEILEGLRELGYDRVKVVAGADGEFRGELEQRGFDVDVVTSRKLGRRPAQILAFLLSVPGSVLGIRRRLASEPGVVYVNTLMFPQAVLAGVLARQPVVVHVREVSRTYPRWLYRCYVRFTARFAKAIVAVADHVVRQPDFAGVRGAVAKSTVVYNSAQMVTRDPVAVAEDLKRIVMLMPLTVAKGARSIVPVISALKARRAQDDWIVTVVGRQTDQDLRDEIERDAREMGLSRHLELRGPTSDVAGVLRHATILLQLSRTEALPRVLIEAAAAGVVVVASDVGATREIVDHGGSGFVHPLEDVEGIAESLARLLADSCLRDRMGEAARARHACSFARPVMARGVASVIERVASGGPREGELR